jgi:integrase
MQWDEIDRDNAVWVVPSTRMKTGETFSVPLSDRALDILAEARRAARKPPGPDSFVFFGVIPKRPLSNMALPMLIGWVAARSGGVKAGSARRIRAIAEPSGGKILSSILPNFALFRLLDDGEKPEKAKFPRLFRFASRNGWARLRGLLGRVFVDVGIDR